MQMWIIIGFILLSLEIISFSFFLIFFGLAAFFVAGLLMFFSISLPVQIFLFSLFSAIFFFAGKRAIKNKKKDDTTLTDEMIGKIAIAQEDAKDHSYLKVMIGDTLWQAYTKEPVKKGQQVKVTNSKNLTVEITSL